MVLSLILFVDFREFGVDDVFVRFRLGSRLVSGAGFGAAGSLLLLLVHRLAELHRRLGERIGLLGHLRRIAAFDRGLGLGERALDFRLHFGGNLVAMLIQLLLGRMDQAFGLVLRLRGLASLLVLVGELLGFTDHLVDVGIAEPTRGLEADVLLLAVAFVLGG